MEVTEEALAAMFGVLGPLLNERQRRLLAGVQAWALGRGGIAVVARTWGMSHSTVHLGISEIDQGPQPAGSGTRSRQVPCGCSSTKPTSIRRHALGG